MKTSHRVVIVAIVALIGGTPTRAQAPKPTPQHEQLKKLVGSWDAKVKFLGKESKGTMTYRQQHGGLWLVSHFSGEIGGGKFEGDGLDGYDSLKQKFVSIWADSLAPEVLITEGTWDKEKKQMTMTGKGIGQDGKAAKIRTVTTWNNDDDIDFVFYMSNADGKEQEIVKIAYNRKK
jgi:hypothetical protein